MLTYNAKSFIAANLHGSTTIKIKKVDGTDASVSSSSFQTYLQSFSANFSSGVRSVLRIGKGTASADYNLADKIALTDYSINTATHILTTDAYDYKVVLSIQCTWNGANNTNITEIGLFAGWAEDNCYLMAREVLDSPITVNYGDTFSVSMTIG